jgi:transposase-like protein
VPLSKIDSGTPPEGLGSFADRVAALDRSLRADPKLSNSALAETHGLSRTTVAKRRAKLGLDPSPCRGDSTDLKPSEEGHVPCPVSEALGDAPAGDDEDHDPVSSPETRTPLPEIAITNTEPVTFPERLEAVHRALRADSLRSNTSLAEEYGVSRDTVARARPRLGLGPSTCRGGLATPAPEACHDEPGVIPPGLGEGPAGDDGEDGGSGVRSPGNPFPTRERRCGTTAEKCDAVRHALRADPSQSDRAMARAFGVSRHKIRKLRMEDSQGPSKRPNGSGPRPSVPRDEAAGTARVVGPEVGSDDRLIAEEAFFVRRFKSCPEDLRGRYPAMLRRLADWFDGRLNEPSNRTMDHPDEKGRAAANGFGAMSQRRPPLE